MSALLRRILGSHVLTSWASFVLRGALVLILLPVIGLKFSIAEVALWLLFYTFITLGMIFDFGFAPTFVRFFSYARAGGQGEAPDGTVHDRRDLVRATRYIYVRLALGVTVLLAAVGTWALAKPAAETDLGVEAWLAWAVVLASIAVAMAGQMYAAFLHGHDQINVARRNEVLGYGAAILLSYGALSVADLSFVVVVFLSSLGPFIFVPLNRVCARRAGFEDDGAPPSRPVLSAVWADAWRVGLGVTSLLATYQAIGFLLGQVLSPAALASYLIGFRLMQAAATVANMPFYTRIPDMARRFGEGDRAGLFARMVPGAAQTFALMVGFCLLLAVTGPGLLAALGTEVAFPEPLHWLLLSVLALTERITALYGQMLLIGRKVVVHIANGVASGMIIALCYPLGQIWGLSGVILAMILPLLLFDMPYCARAAVRLYGPGALGRLHALAGLAAAGMALGFLGVWSWSGAL